MKKLRNFIYTHTYSNSDFQFISQRMLNNKIFKKITLLKVKPKAEIT